MSVVLTAVLVFAAIGRRDRLDQGNRTQRPRGPKKPRDRQEGAKEGPRETKGEGPGRTWEAKTGGGGQGGNSPGETQGGDGHRAQRARYYLGLSDMCCSYRFV